MTSERGKLMEMSEFDLISMKMMKKKVDLIDSLLADLCLFISIAIDDMEKRDMIPKRTAELGRYAINGYKNVGEK